MRGAAIGRRGLLGVAAAALGACTYVPDDGPAAPVRRASGEPPRFVFTDTDGTVINARSLRGRVTAIAFVTTYDVPSQALVQRLNMALQSHTPRINALAVVLEAPDHAELAAAFKDTLGLDYPVALADYFTRGGKSDFGDLRTVPTLIILDRRGRIRFRQQGLLGREALERELNRAR